MSELQATYLYLRARAACLALRLLLSTGLIIPEMHRPSPELMRARARLQRSARHVLIISAVLFVWASVMLPVELVHRDWWGAAVMALALVVTPPRFPCLGCQSLAVKEDLNDGPPNSGGPPVDPVKKARPA